MADKPDLQSLLREAAKIPGVNTLKQEVPEEIIKKATEITEQNLEDKWGRVKEMMEGPFADRLIKEMEELNGREFIRVYGKMIEYFKPKVVRVETQVIKEEDRVLRIEIYNSNAPVISDETIDITHEEDGTK